MFKRTLLLMAIAVIVLAAPSAFADCFSCSTDMVPGVKMCKADKAGTMSSCWADCQGTSQTCLEYPSDPGAGGGGGTYYGPKCTSTDGYCPPSCMSCSPGMKV